MTRGDLSRTAVGAARDARQRLAEAMATLQEATDTAEPVARRVALAVRHLFTAETRDEAGILASMGEAIEILRAVLADAQDDTSNPAVRDATGSLAGSLTILYPAREELARSLTLLREEPVLLLDQRREANDERRKNERVAIEAVIGFHTETNFFTGFSGDLSDGGLFVATWDLLPVGTTLELSFVLPEGRQINAGGRVGWIRARPRSPDEKHEPGMGIVFEELGEGDRHAIQRFIRTRAPLFHS